MTLKENNVLFNQRLFQEKVRASSSGAALSGKTLNSAINKATEAYMQSIASAGFPAEVTASMAATYNEHIYKMPQVKSPTHSGYMVSSPLALPFTPESAEDFRKDLGAVARVFYDLSSQTPERFAGCKNPSGAVLAEQEAGLRATVLALDAFESAAKSNVVSITK